MQQVYLRVQVRKATQVPTCTTCCVEAVERMGREWPVWWQPGSPTAEDEVAGRMQVALFGQFQDAGSGGEAAPRSTKTRRRSSHAGKEWETTSKATGLGGSGPEMKQPDAVHPSTVVAVAVSVSVSIEQQGNLPWLVDAGLGGWHEERRA